MVLRHLLGFREGPHGGWYHMARVCARRGSSLALEQPAVRITNPGSWELL